MTLPESAATVEYLSDAADRKRLLDRLARVEGQLRGVQKMIAQGDDCERVVQQMAAARGGLHRAFCDLLACAFESKLGEDAPPEARLKLNELSELLKKYA